MVIFSSVIIKPGYVEKEASTQSKPVFVVMSALVAAKIQQEPVYSLNE